MRYFLDTNIFLRFLVPDDENAHAACKLLFQRINEKKIRAATSSLVYAEIVWVLQSFYKFPKQKIAEALKVFSAAGIMFHDRVELSHAIDLYEAHNVKFIDALLASHPLLQSGEAVMVSYDTDFDKLGIRRIEPHEAISQEIKKHKKSR